MKTSDILIKAGQIYIDAGKKIAEAEKILQSISSPGYGKESKTKPKSKPKSKHKSQKTQIDTTGMQILEKLNEFEQKTEKIAKDLTGK